MKYILTILITIMLTGCYYKEPEKTGLEGKPIPSIKLLLIDSITYLDTKNISSNNPVVLFFLGPHCPYSKSQMEEIIEDMKKLKDINFYVFTNSPFLDMKKFYLHYKLNKYPNIITGVDYKNSFAKYFEASVVPFMAIYGKNKRLNAVFAGRIYSSQIKNAATK